MHTFRLFSPTQKSQNITSPKVFSAGTTNLIDSLPQTHTQGKVSSPSAHYYHKTETGQCGCSRQAILLLTVLNLLIRLPLINHAGRLPHRLSNTMPCSPVDSLPSPSTTEIRIVGFLVRRRFENHASYLEADYVQQPM